MMPDEEVEEIFIPREALERVAERIGTLIFERRRGAKAKIKA